MKTIKPKGTYYVLLCDCSEKEPLVCGVFASEKEAQETNEEIKSCGGKHSIKKCQIIIQLRR